MAVELGKETLDRLFGLESRGSDIEARARTSRQQFVRSQDHLAFATPSATGLRLSAFQALQSFGVEVLLDVFEHGTAVLITSPEEPAQTLREQRERLGLAVGDLATRLQLRPEDIRDAEDPATRTGFPVLISLAQALALDELRLGFQEGAGGDPDLAVRLREVAGRRAGLRPATVLALDEAAWVTATQARLTRWLHSLSDYWSHFTPSSQYGQRDYPAWQHGYFLAHKTREILGLGDEPIPSMRDLIEKVMAVPLIQMQLPRGIGGATISIGGERGIVGNTIGANENPCVRRATLAHELGHLLWDPDDKLRRLVVDDDTELESLHARALEPSSLRDIEFDPVEARANAFAIAFLAPQKAALGVFEKASSPSDGLLGVMNEFGISQTAAKYHLWNALDRRIDLAILDSRVSADTEKWRATEESTLDFFRPVSVPMSRRGRFAYHTVIADIEGIISTASAAVYLGCTLDDYQAHREDIKGLYA